MTVRHLTPIACLCLVALTARVVDAAEQPEIAAVLNRFCVRCHGPEKQEGGLRVDSLTSNFAERETARAWIEVRNAVNLGEMPPADEQQPPVASIEQVSRWVSAGLREAERAKLSTGGHVLLRRMNRHEYTHTVADLLLMKFPTGESPLDVLPPDGTAEGFDKVSAALLLDPSLMEHYYRVARRIADRAIVDGPPEFPTEKMRLEFEDIPDSGAIGYPAPRNDWLFLAARNSQFEMASILMSPKPRPD